MTLYIDYGLCEGCGACVEIFPDLFKVRDDKAWVIDPGAFRPGDEGRLVACCFFGAITVE